MQQSSSNQVLNNKIQINHDQINMNLVNQLIINQGNIHIDRNMNIQKNNSQNLQMNNQKEKKHQQNSLKQCVPYYNNYDANLHVYRPNIDIGTKQQVNNQIKMKNMAFGGSQEIIIIKKSSEPHLKEIKTYRGAISSTFNAGNMYYYPYSNNKSCCYYCFMFNGHCIPCPCCHQCDCCWVCHMMPCCNGCNGFQCQCLTDIGCFNNIDCLRNNAVCCNLPCCMGCQHNCITTPFCDPCQTLNQINCCHLFRLCSQCQLCDKLHGCCNQLDSPCQIFQCCCDQLHICCDHFQDCCKGFICQNIDCSSCNGCNLCQICHLCNCQGCYGCDICNICDCICCILQICK